MTVTNGQAFEAWCDVRPDRPVRPTAARLRRASVAHSRPAPAPADPVLDPQETNAVGHQTESGLSQNRPGFFQLNCMTRHKASV